MNAAPGRPAARLSAATLAKASPELVEALSRGDKAEAIRLMRQMAGVLSNPARSTASGLSPGEVPRRGRYIWLAVLAAALAFIAYRYLHSL